jgi:hypothetical protein
MARQIVGYTGSKGNIPIYQDVPDASADMQAKISSGQWQPEQNGSGGVTSYIQRNPDGTVTRFGADGNQMQDSWTPSVGSDGILGTLTRAGLVAGGAYLGSGALGYGGAAGAGEAAAASAPVYGGSVGGWTSGLGAADAGFSGMGGAGGAAGAAGDFGLGGAAGGVGGTAASGAGTALTGAGAASSGGLFGSGISAGTAGMIGANLIGSSMGADAAKSAAGIQAKSAQDATNLQTRIYDESVARSKPFYDTSVQANNKLSGLLGLNGQSPTSVMENDPGYQFRMDQGQKTLDNSAASRGMTLSGAAQKALAKYGQDYASGEYNNVYNRLSSTAGGGQVASNMNNLGASYGTNVSNNITGAGNANAAGTVGAANAWGNGLQSTVNNYQQNQLMNLLQSKQSTGASNGY